MIHPSIIAVATALHREHFVIAFGSEATADRHVEKNPLDPESPGGEDYIREALAAISAWEANRPK